MEEIPEVIPDTGDTEVVVDGSMDLHGANQGLSYLMLPSKISSEIFFFFVILENDKDNQLYLFQNRQ